MRGASNSGLGRHRRGAAALALVAALVVGVAATASGPVQAASTAPLATSVISDAITFEDNFDNGQTHGWTAESLTGLTGWAADDGGVRAARLGPGASASTFVTGNGAWHDYELSATMRPGGAGPVGLEFRRSGAASLYRFEISPTAQHLVRVLDGVATTLDTEPVGYVAGSTIEVTIVAVGGDIEVRVDGDVTLVATDPNPLPSGKIGLYSGSTGSVLFDDVRVLASAHQGFTLAVLPDTQHYTMGGSVFADQTTWVAANRASQKIVALLHEGDVVEDWACTDQWQLARSAMSNLQGKLPVVMASGNHDVIQYSGPVGSYPGASCSSSSVDTFKGSGRFGSYFPIGDFDDLGTFDESAPQRGSFEGRLDNSYQLVSAGGVDLLLLSLTFGPSDEVLAWADTVVKSHPDRTVVIVTHDYLGDDNRFRGGRPCPTADRCEIAIPGGAVPFPYDPNTGVEMWNELVKGNSNIRVVLNGHVISCDLPQKSGADCGYSAGRRTDVRADGSRVYSILANYQNAGGGYLRLLKFDPAAGSISVSTVSPVRGQPPLTDDENQFVLDLSTPASGTFFDVLDDHAFAGQINRAASEGLVQGFSDATFRPTGTLLRQAAAVMLYRAQAKGDPDFREGRCDDASAPGGVVHSPFVDVADDSPFCFAIFKMVEWGRITGFGDEFRPTAPVTRQAFAAFMHRTPSTGSCAPFRDVDSTNPFCDSIATAAGAGIATGYDDGSFRPASVLTRQGAAVMLMRFVDTL